MQAAEKLFTSRRFHEITLDEIAREARVGKGTIYLHFKDKDELFLEVATSGFDELRRRLRRRVPGDAPFERQLLHACEAVSAFFRTRRQLFRMMQTEDVRMAWCRGRVRERWIERRRELACTLGEIVGKGVTEGKIRSDIPPELLAEFLLGMLRTLAREAAGDGDSLRRPAIVMELFLHGAASPGRRFPPGEGDV